MHEYDKCGADVKASVGYAGKVDVAAHASQLDGPRYFRSPHVHGLVDRQSSPCGSAYGHPALLSTVAVEQLESRRPRWPSQRMLSGSFAVLICYCSEPLTLVN